MYQVDTIVNSFLFLSVCGSVPAICPAALSNGISYIQLIANISLFPNPASDILNIQSSERILNIGIYDETGRLVQQFNNINALNYQLNTSHFSKGIYFVKFDAGENYSPAIKKVVIE
jgi:hypothetical protein